MPPELSESWSHMVRRLRCTYSVSLICKAMSDPGEWLYVTYLIVGAQGRSHHRLKTCDQINDA